MIEPNRTVTVEPENPSNPSLGPDPLALENNDILEVRLSQRPVS